MKKTSLASFITLPLLATILFLSFAAEAQPYIRTWISGVGDDVNPCTRALPGKTFAGALSKTLAGGEIDAMDSGGFGHVSINKAVTLDGAGTLASLLVDNTSGVYVGAGSNDVVTLRNLAINGNGDGTDGILIVSARAVRIENCVIFGFVNSGINFTPMGTNTSLYIENCHIYDCPGNAIISTAGAGAKTVIVNTIIERCGTGVQDTTGTTTIMGSTITACAGVGMAATGTGQIRTFHNNQIFGNNPDGNPTGSLPLR